MTEKPLDSGLEGEGVQGVTTPQTSTPSSDQLNFKDINALAAALVENEIFSDALGRAVQGQKDRRFSKLTNKIDGFAEKLAEYESLTTGDGAVSPAVALRLMELKDAANVAQDPGKVEPTSKVDYGDVVASMGLDPGDAEVVKITLNGGDFATNVNKLATLAKAKRQASAAAPTSQAGPMPVGGGSPVAQADLQTQYNAELEKVRQGDVRAINDLKAKYRKLGLPVY